MIGHPYGLLSPGLQCVVGGGPIPQPAPPGGCDGAVTTGAAISVAAPATVFALVGPSVRQRRRRQHEFQRVQRLVDLRLSIAFG